MNRQGLEAVARWLGHGLNIALADQVTLLGSGQWLTLRYGSRTLRLRQTQQHTEMIFTPVTLLTDFLLQIESDSTFPIALSAPPDQTPYTLVSDRKSQFDYYLTQECTSQRRRCVACHNTELFPLSRDTGTQRDIRWWCGACLRQVEIDFFLPIMDDTFLESLGIGRFTGRRFLSLPVTDADMEYLCGHLPLGKAAGQDGLPYELIRNALPFAQRLLRRMYDEILAEGTESRRNGQVVSVPISLSATLIGSWRIFDQ
eukprot:2754150-Rhodomonas_salina.2